MQNIPWNNPIVISGFINACAVLGSGFIAALMLIINGVIDRKHEHYREMSGFYSHLIGEVMAKYIDTIEYETVFEMLIKSIYKQSNRKERKIFDSQKNIFDELVARLEEIKKNPI